MVKLGILVKGVLFQVWEYGKFHDDAISNTSVRSTYVLQLSTIFQKMIYTPSIGKQLSDWIYFNVIEHLNLVHLLHLKYAGRQYQSDFQSGLETALLVANPT